MKPVDTLDSLLASVKRGLPAILTLLKARGLKREDRLALVNVLSAHAGQ